jgi:hypothetical protein
MLAFKMLGLKVENHCSSAITDCAVTRLYWLPFAAMMVFNRVYSWPALQNAMVPASAALLVLPSLRQPSLLYDFHTPYFVDCWLVGPFHLVHSFVGAPGLRPVCFQARFVAFPYR